MNVTILAKKIEEIINDFDVLVDFLNQEGAQKFSVSDHLAAKKLLEKVEKIKNIRDDVASAYSELLSISDSSIDVNYQKTSLKVRESLFDFPEQRQYVKEKAKNGVKKTRQERFRIPILIALESLGGSAYCHNVLEIVEDLLKDEFTATDYGTLPSDHKTIRWRNTAMWARNSLRSEGFLKNKSPRGIWELDQAGWDYLEKLSNKDKSSIF